MWLHICQGLMLLGWLGRMVMGVVYAASGREAAKATGAVGIFVAIIWHALTAVVIWRSGALSTIVGSP